MKGGGSGKGEGRVWQGVSMRENPNTLLCHKVLVCFFFFIEAR